MESYLNIIGPLISAFIDVYLMGHFFEKNYVRKYQNKKAYKIIFPVIVLTIAIVNSFHQTWFNIMAWILVCIVFGFVLYYDNIGKKIPTFFKAILLFSTNGLLEVISFFLLKFIVNNMYNITISGVMYNFLNLTITKILNIIIYFALIKQLLGKNKLRQLSYWHYITYFFLIALSFLGTFVAINVSEDVIGGGKALIITLYLIMIVSVNLFTLSLLDSLAENIELKIQLGIFEQQEIMQERYYDSLDERYNQSLKVLHDVDKHIRVIEGLYQKGKNGEAMEYTKEISSMLLPLIPVRYVSNDILNIILNDKAEVAKKNDIEFECSIEENDYGFLKNTDITTIFSNLLDNAIEACMQKEGTRHIIVTTRSQYDILMIEIRNSIGKRPIWREGRLVSQKGGNHGIGLKNVEKVIAEHEGMVDYRVEGEEFICNIFLSNYRAVEPS